MRVAFVGTHCTGKTSLLEVFPKRYPQISCHIIDEKARELIKKGHELTINGNTESYIAWINEKMLSERESINENYDVLISDRCMIDIISYAKIATKTSKSFVDNSFIQLCENIFLSQKNFYDCYIYFPIEFPMEEDAVRPNDEQYRIAIGEMIKSNLEKYSLRHITIKGDLETRCALLHNLVCNG